MASTARPPVIAVEALRTPFGSHGGKLSNFHAVELLASAFTAAIERSGIPANRIDQVIAGCAVPIGEQAVNVARNAVLAAGWSESIPAHTVDAQGASGIIALQEAFARIASGMARICLVGAVSSTHVPDGATSGVAVGKPFGQQVHDRYAELGGLRSPGMVAEHLAASYEIDRKALDEYAEQSIASAREAEKPPYLLEIRNSKRLATVVSEDELVPDRDLSKLEPLFEKDGLLTAATFAIPVNGAVAILLAHPDEAIDNYLGEIITSVSLGSGVLNGSSGFEVADLALKGVAKKLRKQIAHIEVHEDTAVTPVAFQQQFGSAELINKKGGALATGDPFGVSALASVCEALHSAAVDQSVGLVVSAGYNALSTATLVGIHR